MTDNPGSRRFSSRRPRPGVIVVALVSTVAVFGVALFVAWLTIGGGVWRGEVRVMEAALRAPDKLMLAVASCHGDPEVSFLRESDSEVQVKVVSSTWPFGPSGGCQDPVEIQLQKPLGDRVVVDKHTGQSVSVRTFNFN